MLITKNKNGESMEIFVEGSVDTLSSPKLLDFVNDVIVKGENNIVIDFAKVDYISSAGLKVCLAVSRAVEGKGSLVLRNMCPRVKEVFNLTGFLPLFNIE